MKDGLIPKARLGVIMAPPGGPRGSMASTQCSLLYLVLKLLHSVWQKGVALPFGFENLNSERYTGCTCGLCSCPLLTD